LVPNIKCIIIITDTIHTAKHIFNLSSHSYQLYSIAVFQDFRAFFKKSSSNSITFGTVLVVLIGLLIWPLTKKPNSSKLTLLSYTNLHEILVKKKSVTLYYVIGRWLFKHWTIKEEIFLISMSMIIYPLNLLILKVACSSNLLDIPTHYVWELQELSQIMLL